MARKPETANAVMRGGPVDGTLMILRPPWAATELPPTIDLDVTPPTSGPLTVTYKRTSNVEDGGALVVYRYVKSKAQASS